MPKISTRQEPNNKKSIESMIQPIKIVRHYSSMMLSSNLVLSPNQSHSKNIINEYIINNYLIKKTLGEGNFGKVKLGIYLPTKEKFAIKILQKNKIQGKNDETRLKREFIMLSKFNHINVISIEDFFESEENYYSIMEYCEGGELFNYIMKKKYLSESESAFFYYQLINGLEYIHSLGIVHRDLKPENLLLTKNHILKIIDFGLSNYFNKDNPNDLLSTPCGSPCYAAPEMVMGKKYDGIKIDIWTSGIVLYAMVCGTLPFEENDNQKLFKAISECKIDFPNYITKDAKNLMNKILVKDPDKRISIKEIKKDKFYLKGKNMFEQLFNLERNCSRNSSTSIKSQNEQEFKITISNIDISGIIDNSNMTDKDEEKQIQINKKENLNGLNGDLLTLSNEKIFDDYNNKNNSKSFSSIINNEQKKLSENNKKNLNPRNKSNDNENKNKSKNIDKNDFNPKIELKREKFKNKNIFNINKNKIKFIKRINKFNNRNINNLTANSNEYKNRTKTLSSSRKKKFAFPSIFKNNLRNKNNHNNNLINQINPYETRNNKHYLKTDNNTIKNQENFENINYRNRKSISINNRKIKSENKNRMNPIKEYLNKIRKQICKHNTNAINSKINNAINVTNVGVNVNKNQRKKGNIIITKKIQKNYIIDIKGHKKKLNIINHNKKDKKFLKDYLKIPKKVEKRENNNKIKISNLYNKSKNIQNIQLKVDSNYSTVKNFTKNNSLIKIKTKKNEIFPKELHPTRNIKNKLLQNTTYFLQNTNNSFKNISFYKIQKNHNSKTSLNLKNLFNSKNINKIDKRKKNSLTIKNTVINLNMINSNLIISSLHKKFIKKTHTNPISKKVSETKIKELNTKLKGKSKFSNLKLKYNILRNLQAKNKFLNFSQNWAKTEINDLSMNKSKNKLEKNNNKLKQDLLKENKNIIFNSMQMKDIHSNNKIIKKTKTSAVTRIISKKDVIENKTISPKYNHKKIKNIIHK